MIDLFIYTTIDVILILIPDTKSVTHMTTGRARRWKVAGTDREWLGL